MATNLALRFDGDMGQVARLIGGELMADHRNADLIQQYFSQKGFVEMDTLMGAVRNGVPVDVEKGGDLAAAMQYGNHSSAHTHYDLVWQRLIDDIRWGRVVVLHKSAADRIKHLRVSPLGVTSSKDKLRVILDLSFGMGGENGENIGANGDTWFENAPKSETGEVMPNIMRRICALRQAVGPAVPIYTSKLDVKDAFRRLHVEWDKAPTFAYVVGDFVVVDFRLPFGWRNSPGWWALHASAVRYAYCNTNVRNAIVLPDACEIAKDVQVVQPLANSLAKCAPPGVQVTPLPGDPLDGNFDAEMYVDDMVTAEACLWGNEERLLVATKSAVYDHLRMLGSSADNPVPVMSAKKLTNWTVAQEILGFVIDTQNMRISVPPRKIDEIRDLLRKWPMDRRSARIKEVESLIGKLRHFTIVIRPGRYMVWRLQRAVGLAADHDFSETIAMKEYIVELSEEFHADLEWWKWAVYQRALLEGVSLYSSFYKHVYWAPVRHWLSDATPKAIGGFCWELRVWWRYDLSVDEQCRLSKDTTCALHNKLSINLLELLAMVVTAYVMVVVKGDLPTVNGEPVLMRGDSSSAVTWVNRCGGTRDPRTAFIMRWLGVLEVNAGWCFESVHIPGYSNVLADGITRWNRSDIPRKLTLLSPPSDIPWQEASLGEIGGRACSAILQPFSHASELRRRLTQLMPQIGNCG